MEIRLVASYMGCVYEYKYIYKYICKYIYINIYKYTNQ